MRNNQQEMLEDINAEVRYTHSLIGKDALDPRVMEAVRKVPRDAFVPPNMKSAAFENGPLPIGYGQTISQPYALLLPPPPHIFLQRSPSSSGRAAGWSFLWACPTATRN